MSARPWQDRLGGRALPAPTGADADRSLRLRYRAWAASAVVAILAGLAFLLDARQFQVEQVILTRAGDYERVSGTTFQSVASVVGRNIFTISAPQVAEQVASLPGVRRARVIPRLPNVIEIEVEERLPVIAWRTFAGDVLVDDQGFVVAAVTGADAGAVAGAFPVVVDTSGAYLQPGDRVPARAVLAIGAIAAAFEASRLPVEAMEFGATGLSFVIDGGTRVVMGEPDELNAKFGHMLAVRASALEQGIHLVTLDVRAPTRPSYRVATPSPTPAATPRAAATTTPARS